MAKKSNKSIRADVEAKRKVAAKEKAEDKAKRQKGIQKQLNSKRKPK